MSTAARLVPDENLAADERVTVGAMRRSVNNPTLPSPDELTDVRHRATVSTEDDVTCRRESVR
jgi:hypothetical protein